MDETEDILYNTKEPYLKRVLQSIKYESLWIWGSSIISLLVWIYIPRFLSSEALGIYAILVTIKELAFLIPSSLVSNALIQWKEISEKDLRVCSFLSTLFSGVFFFPFTFIVISFMNTPVNWFLLTLVFLALVLDGASFVPFNLLYRTLDFKAKSLLSFTQITLQNLSILALLASGAGLISLFLGLLIGSLVRFTFFSLRHSIYSFSISRNPVKKLFSYSSPLVLSTLLDEGAERVGRYLTAFLLGTSPLGFLYLALRYSRMALSWLLTPLLSVLFPLLSRLQDSEREFREYHTVIYKSLTILSFVIGLALLLFSPFFIDIVIGEEWRPVVPILYILGISFFLPVCNTGYVIVESKGWTKKRAKIEIILSLTYVTLFFPLILTLGILGVAITGVLAYGILGMFVYYYYTKNYFPRELFRFHLMVVCIATFTFLFMKMVAFPIFYPYNIVNLIVDSFIAFGIFLVASITLLLRKETKFLFENIHLLF